MRGHIYFQCNSQKCYCADGLGKKSNLTYHKVKRFATLQELQLFLEQGRITRDEMRRLEFEREKAIILKDYDEECECEGHK